MTVKEAIQVLQQISSDRQVKLVFTDKEEPASSNDYGPFGDSYAISRPYE